MAGKKIVIVGEVYDPTLGIGGGPIIPPEGGAEPPLGIWGPTDPRPTPPIYIPVPPPPESGLSPEHPIFIPVYPAHPIVIPVPPQPPSGGGEHPEHPIPPVVWPPMPPKPPLGIWGPTDPRPTPPIHLPPVHAQPPIYIPIIPPEGGGEPGTPAHPIYMPVYPSHPIVLPPDEEEPPKPPPGMINPPTGLPGFWGYSMYYDSYVFVPYAGSGVGPNPPSGGRRSK
jgi:hypothetical protein